MRIAVMQFSHETVTFLKNDTTVEDFIYPGSPMRDEALLSHDPRAYMGGFVKLAREHADVELVGIESPGWPKTGTGSGWVTAEAFERFTGRMVEELKARGPFDGAYLCIHGAMGVRGVPRPEAELARRVRAVIGPRAFIAATFDPHANEDEEFLRHADMAFCVKYFPHYDMHLQGERAGRMLVRAIRGDYKPSTVTVKVPIITATVLQWTGASPWMDLVQRALTWEAREPDVYVNFMFGFPWADVPDVGITVQVLTNDKPDLARKIADDMAQAIWRQRKALVGAARVHLIAEGVALAGQAVKRGEAPVVLADHSDRSGYATWILKEVIAQDLRDVLFATIADAEAADALQKMKPGDPFDRMIGGRVDESAGEPVRITGTVRLVSPHGGAVDFGKGNCVAISRYLAQVTEPSQITGFGLDLARFKVFAIKSRVHFRRGFDDSGFAKTILLVEPSEPFLGTVRLDALPYENVDLKRFYPYADLTFP
ncbi:MAG: M81 family metallopeptidase [Alphaproteobacteria bacterium]|nr:M81 family metallopeptidase [Alphaproteobacteria bacterium]MCW5743695.1 M81 family metallopeptidase [Alphaproteobacteria bacterium]